MLPNVEQTLVSYNLYVFQLNLAQMFAFLEEHVHCVVVPDASVGEVYTFQERLM